MRIGIVGGGQLARMLALASHPLGFECLVWDGRPDGPAAAVAPTISATFDDAHALGALARCDVVTYESENLPLATLERLEQQVRVLPRAEALAVTGDRLSEKRFFRELGIPTATFHPVSCLDELRSGVGALGLPAILKTRRAGYDGKGQRLLRRPGDLEPAWRELGGVPSIVEEFVDFDREVSLLAVRGADGKTRFWTPTQNEHVGGILRVSTAPAASLETAGLELARGWMERLLDALDYIGVMALEFFIADGQWIANEAACRVHNSGHWTIEGAVTSQFENHMRAVTGMPLGSTLARGQAVMVNLVGRLPRPESVLDLEGAHWHDYGKEPAPDRKLGHVTLTAARGEGLGDRVRELARRLEDPSLEAALRTPISFDSSCAPCR